GVGTHPRLFPLRHDPSLPLQPVERGIERAVLDLENVLCSPLDMLRDLMTVSRAKLQRSQDQHIQRALQQFKSVNRFGYHGVGRYSTLKQAQMVDALPRFWL